MYKPLQMFGQIASPVNDSNDNGGGDDDIDNDHP